VETFEGPVLKTKGISASDLPTCEGWAKEGFLAFRGSYTYAFDSFNPSRCQKLELKILSEDDPSKPDIETIPAKTVQRVWADFEGYRKVAKPQ